MQIRWFPNFCLIYWLFLAVGPGVTPAPGQCAGLATTPAAAADSASNALPQNTVATIDPHHRYALAELVYIRRTVQPPQFVDASLFADPRIRECTQNALTRFRELEDYVLDIDTAG